MYKPGYLGRDNLSGDGLRHPLDNDVLGVRETQLQLITSIISNTKQKIIYCIKI